MKAIYWFLNGNQYTASSRIHGINIHSYLKSLGYNSNLQYINPPPQEGFFLSTSSINKFIKLVDSTDVLVIQKIKSGEVSYLFDQLQRKGVKCVYIDCDIPIAGNVASRANTIVCPSDYMVAQYKNKGFSNVEKIIDAPELFVHPKKNRDSAKVKIAWFGNLTGERIESIYGFKRKLLEWYNGRIEFNIVSNHPKSDVKWLGLDTLLELSGFDLIVLPKLDESKDELVKSSNKLLQSMALGVPVLAWPLQSYLEVEKGSKVKFICKTDNEWRLRIKRYLDSKEREKDAAINFRRVQSLYSLTKICEKWISLFEQLNIYPEVYISTLNSYPTKEVEESFIIDQIKSQENIKTMMQLYFNLSVANQLQVLPIIFILIIKRIILTVLRLGYHD